MTEARGPDVEPAASRWIPMSVPQVLDVACADVADEIGVRRVADLVGALLHHRYRARWQQVRGLHAADGPAFLDQLRTVLDDANYDEVPRATLEQALQHASLFKVSLHIEFDWFQELLLFRRGGRRRTARLTSWRGRRSRTLEFQEYERVAMYARYRDAQWFRDHDLEVDDLPFTPGDAYAKLFQDVPEADLEMLVPGTEVRMRTVDKLFFGVPAVVGGVVIAVTKLAAALAVLFALGAAAVGSRDTPSNLDAGAFLTLLGGLAAFAGYLWRQWTKFKNRRLSFLKRLSENLYGKTLADGSGVLFTVLDGAEQEDVKEALLAYRGLLDGPLTSAALDARTEALLHDPSGRRVDFDVGDGLGTLSTLGLAHEQDGRWHALAVAPALEVLRQRWREAGDALPAPGRAPGP